MSMRLSREVLVERGLLKEEDLPDCSQISDSEEDKDKVSVIGGFYKSSLSYSFCIYLSYVQNKYIFYFKIAIFSYIFFVAICVNGVIIN